MESNFFGFKITVFNHFVEFDAFWLRGSGKTSIIQIRELIILILFVMDYLGLYLQDDKQNSLRSIAFIQLFSQSVMTDSR